MQEDSTLEFILSGTLRSWKHNGQDDVHNQTVPRYFNERRN